MKKLLALLLTCCLLLPCTSYLAKAESNDKEAVIAAMRCIHPFKDEYGMGNVDFTTLKIGEAINVYDYINDTFVFSRIAYPLFSGNELVAILYNIGDSVYQVMNGMDELIKDIDCSEIAIVYDSDGCHVFDGEEFHQIYVANNPGTIKDCLATDAGTVLLDEIQVSDFTVSYDLGYTNVVTPRNGDSYILGVSYVTQNPYDNLCWAASIAAITNYKTGSSLTAVGVASTYFSSKGLPFTDDDIDITEVASRFSYHLPYMSYSLRYQVPTDAQIANNITAGNPILGSFEVQAAGGWHDIVIRGYDTSLGQLYAIDPQTGFVLIPKLSGWYRFVTGVTGDTLVLTRAICNSWD